MVAGFGNEQMTPAAKDTIPSFQDLMLPVLRTAKAHEAKIGAVAKELADVLNLDYASRTAMLASGGQTIFYNRVNWAKSYLTKAGLIETTRRGYYKITTRGLDTLRSGVERIDVKYLKQFEDFREFNSRPDTSREIDTSLVDELSEKQTPDEILRAAYQGIELALAQDLLVRVRLSPPDFFERLIVSLLLAMGYGGSAVEAGRALGKSGDDGIDGVIDQDPLGLDRVYIQAKRYAEGNSVSSGAIRDFAGSLDIHKATKGLFVTTSTFTASAIETARQLRTRVVFIDGKALAQLMLRYNIGCRIEDTLFLKKIDEDFFEPSD